MNFSSVRRHKATFSEAFLWRGWGWHRSISRALMAADYTLVKALQRVTVPQHMLTWIVFSPREER